MPSTLPSTTSAPSLSNGPNVIRAGAAVPVRASTGSKAAEGVLEVVTGTEVAGMGTVVDLAVEVDLEDRPGGQERIRSRSLSLIVWSVLVSSICSRILRAVRKRTSHCWTRTRARIWTRKDREQVLIYQSSARVGKRSTRSARNPGAKSALPTPVPRLSLVSLSIRMRGSSLSLGSRATSTRLCRCFTL